MKFLNNLTTKFKVFVAFAFIFIAFVILGFNQFLLNKETSLAVNTSMQAVDATTQTVKILKELTITPTATPSALPTKTVITLTPVKTVAPLKK